MALKRFLTGVTTRMAFCPSFSARKRKYPRS
jgi:hypothetical protein